MKKFLTLMTILTVMLTSIRCEKENEEQEPVSEASITIQGGITTITFGVKDTAPKTLTFTSSDAWDLSLENGSWLNVEPASGTAGEKTVTFTLKDGLSETERQDKAIIRAKNTEKSIIIRQEATIPVKAIEIQAIQRKVMPSGTIQMTAVNKANKELLTGVEWYSQNKDCATIDENGLLTAVAVGNTVVEAKFEGLTDTLGIEITTSFLTDGLGKTYTLEDLSKLSTSGVTYENNIATISETITISANDVISLGNAQKVILGDRKELRIEGTLDFVSGNGAVLQTKEGAAKDAQIYFRGDFNGGGKIIGMNVEGVFIRCFGVDPIEIRNCKFTGIRERKAAISLGTEALTTVQNCVFIENNYEAISGSGNIASPLIFTDNDLQNNSVGGRNKPQINVVVGGKGDVTIKNNKIRGPFANTRNGGICVTNLLDLQGTNKVVIEKNDVSGCRFGIALIGKMDVLIKDNILTDNKYDEKPTTGGDGVSVEGSDDQTRVIMTGNKITGHLRGVTCICSKEGQGPYVNLGNLTQGKDYNVGNNIFKDNATAGVLYDLYNNSGVTVYAQGNYWNVAVQDEESIEKVIFHKKDDPKLGEVIFMPAGK